MFPPQVRWARVAHHDMSVLVNVYDISKKTNKNPYDLNCAETIASMT